MESPTKINENIIFYNFDQEPGFGIPHHIFSFCFSVSLSVCISLSISLVISLSVSSSSSLPLFLCLSCSLSVCVSLCFNHHLLFAERIVSQQSEQVSFSF